MFWTHPNASFYEIGGVWSQIVDEQENFVAYYSREIAKPEKNYCVKK